MEPHLLILPLPIHGHVKPLLILAELLSQKGLRVTFVNSHHNQALLESSTDVAAFCDRHPKFRFVSLSDGLPPDVPRSGERIAELMFSTRTVMKAEFHELLVDLVNGGGNKSTQPPTCIITDTFMSFGVDFGEEFGIPVKSFTVISASSFWVFCNIPRLAKEGLLPFKGDEPISCIPGLEGILKPRDFPGAGKVAKQSTNKDGLQQFSLGDILTTLRASGLILNVVEELEAPVVAKLATIFPKVYSLGPLHTLLENCSLDPDGSNSNSNPNTISPSSTGVLGEQDGSCLSWLDTKPEKSVMFVSFGSLVGLTQEDTMELWHGLVNSGKPFLWVNKGRPEVVPFELEVATRERGFMVAWAPQVEVLAHPSVGGFMTHNGWNSSMESVSAGIPMICFPGMGDQFLNRRLVVDVWRVGLDMEDKCSRVEVEKVVRELMEEKREELMVAMDEVSRKANEGVKEGGSSYCQLNMLVEDFVAMASAGKSN